jgi:hypothetical protein
MVKSQIRAASQGTVATLEGAFQNPRLFLTTGWLQMRFPLLFLVLALASCAHEELQVTHVPSPRKAPKEFCDGLMQRILRNAPEEFVQYHMDGIRQVKPDAFRPVPNGPEDMERVMAMENSIRRSFISSLGQSPLSKEETKVTLGEPQKLINKKAVIYAYPVLGQKDNYLYCGLNIWPNNVLVTQIGSFPTSAEASPEKAERQ